MSRGWNTVPPEQPPLREKLPRISPETCQLLIDWALRQSSAVLPWLLVRSSGYWQQAADARKLDEIPEEWFDATSALDLLCWQCNTTDIGSVDRLKGCDEVFRQETN